jgi:uncharacterized protein with FMN-binding domain
MTKKKSAFRTLLKVLLIIVLIIAVIAGAFAVFINLGKEKTQMLELSGISVQDKADGIYRGSYKGFRWSTEVEVTVNDHQIENIKVIKKPVFAEQPFITELTDKIIAEQNTDIDAVSGATIDTKAICKAVENALG